MNITQFTHSWSRIIKDRPLKLSIWVLIIVMETQAMHKITLD